jgi:hypothetical protein
MANKPLNVVFKCTPAQLVAAAQKTLGLRNLLETDTIMLNLLATVPGSDAVQDALCKCENNDDGCIVTLRNYTTDQNDNSSEPSDTAEFQKAAKALQDLIFPEQP